MQTLKKRLPPMEPLIAFECAARHLSFTTAAKELNLSQAAVSQQIRNLERSLGVELFTRSHRAIQLSAHGLVYRHSISAALKQVASATTELRVPSANSRLTVAADQSIASMWLIPRLPDFQQLHPEISVRLIASDIEQDCLAEDIDMAIIHGNGNWVNHHSETLFPEEVFAVCSPDYLNRNPKANSLEALTEETLLSLENSHWDWMDWRTWLSNNEVHLPVQHQGLQINSYPLLIEAAKNGQGIALGWRFLIDEYLRNNSLIKLCNTSVATTYGYYLVWPADAEQSPNTTKFRAWANERIASDLST
ncbi:MAG: LysR substrate-binding domain-containing protein [bacterium]